MSAALTKEEKLRFLKALEEDEEFRLAVAAKLGLREILEELRKLREDLNRHMVESSKRFEVLEKKLLEHDKRFEAIERTLLEHSKILQEHSKRIEELAKAVGELKAAVGSLGRRMGRDLEKPILSLYRDAIQRFGIDVERVEKRSFRDYDGKYLQKGAKIELDIYMSDRVTYLIEVKSLADEEDVEWFNTKCSIFAREFNLSEYRKLIVAVNITREALERAKELGIDLVYGSVID